MNMTVFPKRGEGWRVNLANLHRKDCPDSDLEAIYPDLYRQTATKKCPAVGDIIATIVNDNARFLTNRCPVGASLLAMVVNDNAGFLNKRGALASIASKLAPT